MDVSGRRLWVRAMILVAVSYVVIGIGFAALAKSDHMRLWRLAAWVASALVAAAHIGYEHYRLGSSPRPTALHAAGGVVMGRFCLALAVKVLWNSDMHNGHMQVSSMMYTSSAHKQLVSRSITLRTTSQSRHN